MTGIAVVTGGGRGIGLELVRQYVDDGWRVYAGCRQPETATELALLAAMSERRLSIIPLDVSNGLQIAAFKAVLGNKPVDILINNAGVYGGDEQRFGYSDEDRWVETFRVNTVAPLKMMETLVDNVAANKGVMVSLSSKMGSMADNRSGGAYLYRSTKAALNAVVKSAAIDLAARGIRVVALHPGWVRTDMGGPNAEIAVSESAAAMRRIIAGLTLADSGRFIDVDGSIIPW